MIWIILQRSSMRQVVFEQGNYRFPQFSTTLFPRFDSPHAYANLFSKLLSGEMLLLPKPFKFKAIHTSSF